MSHGGKGSKRRPSQISDEELERRWAAIFQASQAVEREPEPDEDWPESLPAYKRQHNGEVIREGFGVDADAGGAPV